MKHLLKIEPVYLAAKLAGDKLFEVRINDKGYQKGDIVIYRDYPMSGGSTSHEFEITYVTHFQQQGSYCVFGEKHIRSGRSND